MSDITMCDAKSQQGLCPLKEDCYRFTATPNPWRQSYFMTAPFVTLVLLSSPPKYKTECEHFCFNKA